ncbi:MAG: hypothetical protein ACOH2Q_05270 [Rhodococcus sp. (in: high G+C Gram-positive bacteria)]
MINTFHAAVAPATIAFSPALGTASLGTTLVGTTLLGKMPLGNAAAAAAGSVAQTWIRSAAFGPLHTCAVSASVSNSAYAAVAPGAKAVAPAARRHRAPGASVIDRRHRLHCR